MEMIASAPPVLSEIGKRYVLRQRIGSGGMGTVYRAFDRLSGRDVALKRVEVALKELRFGTRDPLQSDSENFGVALAQEFKTLASLRHPYIISVLDYGFEKPELALQTTVSTDGRPQPYFTMELLDKAQTLSDAARDRTLTGRIELIQQVLEALTYLHRRGILHRDMKPGNILVQDGAVKVLDFGLAVSRGDESTLAGTLAYLAPELLTGGTSSESTDLYAVGTIFYELLAGRQPFDSGSRIIIDILQTPPDLKALGVPEPIRDIISALLAKRPEDRFKHAADVIAAIERTTGVSCATTTSAIRDSFLQAAQFVGRTPELARLTAALDETVDMLPPYGGAWLIAGESGVGKSRLVEEIRTRALVGGALVLRGQAVSDGSNPFQLWRETLRLIALTAEATDEEAAYIKRLVPDIDELLGRTTPDLPDMDVSMKGQGMLAAVESMVRRLTQPTLIILEDLHWATAEDINVLNRLLGLGDSLPIMWLGTVRDDEAPDLPSRLPNMQLVKLRRLERGEIVQLSQSMIGDAGALPDIIQLLTDETEGNVFFIVEVVRALAEEAGELDRVGSMTLPTRVLTGGVRRVLERRLARVPAEARPLLNLAAVCGRQIDIAVLERTPTRAVAPYTDLNAWLNIGAEAAVFEVDQNIWRFAHDKLREALLDFIPDDQQRTMHAEVARAIEAAFPDDLEQHAAALAYQWTRAGDDAKHAIYAIKAGDAAMNMYALAQAFPYYDDALQLEATLDNDHLAQLYARRGRALELGGQTQAAYANYVQMRAAGDRRSDIALQLGGICGCALLKTLPNAVSNLDEAHALVSEGLDLARASGDRATEARLLWNMMLVSNFRRDYPNSVALGEGAIALARALDLRETLAYTLNDISRAYIGLRRYQTAVATLEEARTLWIDLNNKPMLADSLSGLAQVQYFSGQLDAGLESAEEAYRVASDAHNDWGQAYALLARSYIALQRGEVGLALDLTNRMESASKSGGLLGGLVFAHSTRSLLYAYLADFERARAENRAALDVANQYGLASNFFDFISATYALVCAYEGDEPSVRTALDDLSRAPYDMNAATPMFAGLARARIALQLRAYDEALRAVDLLIDFLRESGVRVFFPDALMIKADALYHLGQPSEARALLVEGRSAATTMGTRRVLWEIMTLLGQVETTLGNPDGAQTAYAEARSALAAIADDAPPDMRARFLATPRAQAVLNAP
ncbi:MAG: protein kinase [Chloroflexota bacterium]|nr:protein kinase [Chloroflexota bacterium]